MDSFIVYAADISLTLQAMGLRPYFLLLLAVSLISWIATIDIRRRRRTEVELRQQILSLRERLQMMGGDLDEQVPPVKGEEPPAQKKTEIEAVPAETASVFSGLSKTRTQFFGKIREVLRGKSGIGAEEYEALEEALISSDLGVQTSRRLLDDLGEAVKVEGTLSETRLRERLKSSIFEILDDDADPEILPEKRGSDPLVILVVGVNGVGKTTTIGKLAARFKRSGAKVLLGACDTFRAAAVEQMQAWARRVDVDVVSGEEGAKPATVAYQSVHKAKDEGYDVLIVDTAGRLHTRVNLMNELSSVVRILDRELAGSPHETLLVIDATTGQNALQQAREFHQKAALSGIVVTKLDGTPKGGIVVAVKDELGIPIRYIGVGEGVDDLKAFSADEFVDALFAEDTAEAGSQRAVSKPLRRVRERAPQ